MNITMGKVVKMLYEEYEKAVKNRIVEKPISWTLYHVWIEVNEIEENRFEMKE